MLVPARARELIEEGAKQALPMKAVAPYDPGNRARSRSSTRTRPRPRQIRFQYGVEFLDGRTIVSRADDWWSAWMQFYFMDS